MLIVVTTFGFANVIDDLAALELAARPLIASDSKDYEFNAGRRSSPRLSISARCPSGCS
jgi:hypothetical protein